MADIKLPWFQFEPSKYEAGNIQFCCLQAQGLYINILSYYWQKECELSKRDLVRKFIRHPDCEKLIEELITEGAIKTIGEKVEISFLDDQWESISARKKAWSKAGKMGAIIANNNRVKNSGQTTLDIAETKTTETKEPPPAGKFFKVGLQLYKGLISEWAPDNIQGHMEEVVMKVKGPTILQVLKEMDSYYSSGYEFTGTNHIRNTFKKIATEMKHGTWNKYGDTTASVSTKQTAPNIDK